MISLLSIQYTDVLRNSIFSASGKTLTDGQIFGHEKLPSKKKLADPPLYLCRCKKMISEFQAFPSIARKAMMLKLVVPSLVACYLNRLQYFLENIFADS